MYRGFKLENFSKNFFIDPITKSNELYYSYYYKKGHSLFEKYNKLIKDSIKKYVDPISGIIDGTMLQKDWFPTINDCDIFISHSHKDEDLAIALAGWLYEEFELNSFIDSCIWGYANDLLLGIDNIYCVKDDQFYDYNLRNYSTSHVHMMLNMALMQMIDKTECLFFLNTPHSIRLSDIKTQTLSPWIYSEIGISQMIEKHEPERFEIFNESYDKRSSLCISYDLDLSHLAEISTNDLSLWSIYGIKKEEALDALYEMIPAPEKQ